MTVTVPKDILTVAGPDAQKFLHSLVSQDVASLSPGDERWSFLLQPQGKVVGFFSISRLAKGADEPDAFELVLDEGAGGRVRDALQRYLIRTKATISLAEGVERPGLTEVERITAGLPRWGREITESTIPNETGLTPIAVNFTKGCYVGQELVERIDSRGGNVPKRLCILRFDGAAVPTDGVAHLEREGKGVGTLTSAAFDPDTGRTIALAYVRREVADGARVDVLWDADGGAGVDQAMVGPLPAAGPIGNSPTPKGSTGLPRFTSRRP